MLAITIQTGLPFLKPTIEFFHLLYFLPSRTANIVSQDHEEDDVNLFIQYYYKNRINYVLENYSDENVKIDGAIKLYKGDELICEGDARSYDLYPNYDDTYYFGLNDRLDAGDYLLELGNLS